MTNLQLALFMNIYTLSMSNYKYILVTDFTHLDFLLWNSEERPTEGFTLDIFARLE